MQIATTVEPDFDWCATKRAPASQPIRELEPVYVKVCATGRKLWSTNQVTAQKNHRHFRAAVAHR